MDFTVIVAVDQRLGIGKNNDLPWWEENTTEKPWLKEDMQHFRRVTSTTVDPTKQNCLIMGRRTWESMGSKPLPKRVNVVLSSTVAEVKGAKWTSESLDRALEAASLHNSIESVFIIGGARLYEEALNHPRCTRVLVTYIREDYQCDVHIKDMPRGRFELVSSQWFNNGEMEIVEFTARSTNDLEPPALVRNDTITNWAVRSAMLLTATKLETVNKDSVAQCLKDLEVIAKRWIDDGEPDRRYEGITLRSRRWQDTEPIQGDQLYELCRSLFTAWKRRLATEDPHEQARLVLDELELHALQWKGNHPWSTDFSDFD